MRSFIKTVGIFSVMALLLSYPTISHAAKQAIPKVEDGMKQGDFALWLVHAIGAVKVQESGPLIQPAGRVPGHLPPAVRGQDAIEFLWGNLGVQVEPEWKRNQPMTREQLVGLIKGYDLNDEDKALVDDTNTSFQKLADVAKKYVELTYNNAKKGVFRVHAATPYLPPV